MKKSFYLAIAICLFGTLNAKINIDEHGIWHGDAVVLEHKTDFALASALEDFFIAEKAKSVADFGCGTGDYVKILRQAGMDADGYDGNPSTPKISEGVGRVVDLAEPVHLNVYDWVISLEVGEKIPKSFEPTFIQNLDRHNTQGIVLAWAVKGQGGFGHFNEQNNDYLKTVMEHYGYSNDIVAEKLLRSKATFWWFKNTLMVFRKN